MNRPIDARAALERWRQAPLGERPSLLDDGAQIRAIKSALGQVAERNSVRRRQRKQWWRVAFAAGVCGLILGGWQLQRTLSMAEPAASLVRVQRTSPDASWIDRNGAELARSTGLGAGEGLETRDGGAQLGFPSGATAQVSKQSRVTVLRAAENEAFSLAAGQVDVEVPALGAGQFSVQTPDALVIVHGTSFSVSVDPAASGRKTRVDVKRGVVSVRAGAHEVWLVAGQHWPADEQASMDSYPGRVEPGVVQEPSPSLDRGMGDRGIPASPGVEARDAPREPRARGARRSAAELREQNRSFARAMELKKHGEPAEALAELDRLQRRYPSSVLDQEIRVERLRLLGRLGRQEEATREARRYLGDYREGYARQEARDIALGAK